MRGAIIGLMILYSLTTFGQRNAYWFFGDSAGLHFDGMDSPSPVLNASLSTLEGCTTMSDEDGNLLFYTNGFNVWDRTGQTMPNGSKLTFDEFGDVDPYLSITQSAISVPIPEENDLYYLIRNHGALRYSIIDMSLNGGLGDVEPGARNLVLDDSIHFSEKMSMVRHGNGKDWWLLVFKDIAHNPTLEYDSAIYRYLINESGLTYIGRQDIIEHIGTPSRIGELSFSPQGDKLAIVSSIGIAVYPFDRCTGLVSNALLFDDRFTGYGCCFSPDGLLLFVTSFFDRLVLQYNLMTWPSLSSLDTTFNYSNANYGLSSIKLGPDGKMYFGIPFASEPNSVQDTLVSNLCVINNPNQFGSSLVDMDTLTISLGGDGRRTKLGLPNIPNYDLGPLVGSECDTITSVGLEYNSTKEIFKLSPNPVRNQLKINTHFKLLPLKFTLSQNGVIKKTGSIFNEVQSIDVSNFNPGLYLLTVIDKQSAVLESKKFIIQ
jgi:hypothetical protein